VSGRSKQNSLPRALCAAGRAEIRITSLDRAVKDWRTPRALSATGNLAFVGSPGAPANVYAPHPDSPEVHRVCPIVAEAVIVAVPRDV